MEPEIWTVRRMALLGAALGAAFAAPEFIREPTAFVLGHVTTYVMFAAILGAIAHRALRVSGGRMTMYIIIAVIGFFAFSVFVYFALMFYLDVTNSN